MSGGAGGAEAAARAFLAALERGDREAARALAAPGYEAESPGGARTGLEPLLDRLATRYRRLVKGVRATDVAEGPDGAVVCFSGEMEGEFADGATFAGVRFMDRIVLRGGRVAAQQMWNDFGQAKPK